MFKHLVQQDAIENRLIKWQLLALSLDERHIGRMLRSVRAVDQVRIRIEPDHACGTLAERARVIAFGATEIEPSTLENASPFELC